VNNPFRFNENEDFFCFSISDDIVIYSAVKKTLNNIFRIFEKTYFLGDVVSKVSSFAADSE
jgi:hypothetical protein